MKVYIPNFQQHAGKWIYDGYAAAWKALGYDVVRYDDLNNISGNYYLMIYDGMVNEVVYQHMISAERCFCFVQPNNFPQPWGSHVNFKSLVPLQCVTAINNQRNIKLWTFADVASEYYSQWKSVSTIPLAFDSCGYHHSVLPDTAYDVCYIGARANNGFDEKIKIMYDYFHAFKESGLKCGFFIDKNLTHQQETNILSNSKVCINIHDAYQRKLGTDCNERTFKSLGLNGILVTDRNKQAERLFDSRVFSCDSPQNMVASVVELVNENTATMAVDNRYYINKNHTYICRVRDLLLL